MPPTFEAYARLLHPAYRLVGSTYTAVRWRELRTEASGALRASTRFEELQKGTVVHQYEAPRVGSLDESDLKVLVANLTRYTTTAASCWFCWWEGYGWLQGPPAVVQLKETSGADRAGAHSAPAYASQLHSFRARVEVPQRRMLLYRGEISDAAAVVDLSQPQTPNLWWPSDRAWCVVSEIDFRSTYVGGTKALIDELVTERRLEALPAQVIDRVTD